MSDERRRYPRYSADDLHGRLDGHWPFEVVKVSLGGMLVTAEEEVALDEVVSVALDLGPERFLSQARVVFVGPDIARGEGFRIGVAFVDPSPAEQLRLERYLRREFE